MINVKGPVVKDDDDDDSIKQSKNKKKGLSFTNPVNNDAMTLKDVLSQEENQAKNDKENQAEFSVQDSTASSDINYKLNTLINYGYNFLLDNSDFFSNPTSMLSNNEIFDYNYDIAKVLAGAEKVSCLKFETKDEASRQIKFIRDYNVTEIQEIQNSIIESGIGVLNNNYIVKRALDISSLPSKTTIYYQNIKLLQTISIEKECPKFPTLNEKFIKDVKELFGVEIINLMVESENKTIYLSNAYRFLEAYGTHFITQLRLGAEMNYFAEVITAKKTEAISKIEEENVFIGGKFEYLQTILEQKRNDLSNEIQNIIGGCEFNPEKNSLDNCVKNFSKLSVIGMKVEPLYNLFVPGVAKQANFKSPTGEPLDVQTLEKIHKNLKSLIDGLLQIMDIRNIPVVNFNVISNISQDDTKFNSCLGKRKRSWIDRNGSVFGENFKSQFTFPVILFDNGKLNIKDNVITSNSGNENSEGNIITSSFACMQKGEQYTISTLSEPYKFNKRFMNSLSIVSQTDIKKNQKKNCQLLWSTGPRNNEHYWYESDGFSIGGGDSILNFYICAGYTTNPFDKNIITDIKMLKGSGDGCGDSFNYVDRTYKCLCDTNLSKLGNPNAHETKYLCYSTIIPVSSS